MSVTYKTADLIGIPLNAAVAKALGITLNVPCTAWQHPSTGWRFHGGDPETWSPSTDWSQGGPIIEREGIAIERSGSLWSALHGDTFSGNWPSDGPVLYGPTPLVAAMRVFVLSRVGETVELPA